MKPLGNFDDMFDIARAAGNVMKRTDISQVPQPDKFGSMVIVAGPAAAMMQGAGIPGSVAYPTAMAGAAAATKGVPYLNNLMKTTDARQLAMQGVGGSMRGGVQNNLMNVPGSLVQFSEDDRNGR